MVNNVAAFIRAQISESGKIASGSSPSCKIPVPEVDPCASGGVGLEIGGQVGITVKFLLLLLLLKELCPY